MSLCLSRYSFVVYQYQYLNSRCWKKTSKSGTYEKPKRRIVLCRSGRCSKKWSSWWVNLLNILWLLFMSAFSNIWHLSFFYMSWFYIWIFSMLSKHRILYFLLNIFICYLSFSVGSLVRRKRRQGQAGKQYRFFQ